MKNKPIILKGILTKFDTMNRNPSRPYDYKTIRRKYKIKKIFDDETREI